MTIAEAIEEFRTAATAKGDFATPATRDHALAARMTQAFRDLASHGSDGFAAFSGLLVDESPHVRGWVAAHLLAEGNKSAIPVMSQLAAEPGIRGFTAATTLKEFYAGRLHSPFTADER